MNNILIALGMFFSGFLADLLWALYIRKIAAKARLSAAIYAVLIGVFSVVFFEGMMQGSFFALFWLFGLFLGTYSSVDFEEWMVKLNNKRKNIK